MSKIIYNYKMKVEQTNEFKKWFKKLRDVNAKSVIGLRINRIKTTGNLGDYKILADGINELRIAYGPGYRIYFVQQEEKIILLLNAGNKDSQQRDIEKAKKMESKYRKGDVNNEKND